jgi:hypothetical protein
MLTPFTGGFHFALWSMLDTALMIQAIGVTAVVVAWIPSPSATPGGVNGEAAKRGRRHR